MSEGGVLYYLLVFGGSGLLSLVLTPLALRVALRRQLLDHPAAHKSQTSPVPCLGGLAIVSAFSFAIAGAALANPPDSGLDELMAILGVALCLSCVGFVDDRRGLPPVVRLLAEVIAGLAVWRAGVQVEMFTQEPINAAFTVLWVVGITNAFNLLDNMDGLSAGVAAIGSGWFFVIAAANGQFLVAALAAALAGCALGYLRHNVHPARIYMGDAGSLFLGFMLAVLGLKLRFAGPNSVTFLVPALVLGMAILDTALVTVCRLRVGRSPFQGGLDHTSHRLVFIGIPIRVAVSLIHSGALALGLIALVVSRVDRGSAYLLAALVLLLGLFLGFLLSRVPVYRGSQAWEAVDRPLRGEEEDGPPRTRQARLGSLFAHSGERADASSPSD